MMKVKIVVIPHLKGIQIMDEKCPSFLPCINTDLDGKTVDDMGKRKRA